jgi:cysteine-rich repeat protein
LVNDNDDICPDTAGGDPVDGNGCSDQQVDSDGDGQCDPDAPSNGPGECTGTDPYPDHPQTCGNGIVELPETCDDGNTVDGDGCSAECEAENVTIPEDPDCVVNLGELTCTYPIVPDEEGVEVTIVTSDPIDLTSITVNSDVDTNNDKSFVEINGLNLLPDGYKTIRMPYRSQICAVDNEYFQVSSVPEDDWFKACKQDPDAILWANQTKCDETGVEVNGYTCTRVDVNNDPAPLGEYALLGNFNHTAVVTSNITIDDLIALVEEYGTDNDDLNTRPFLAKLEMKSGNINQAINDLGAFINSVNASNKLTDEEPDFQKRTLIRYAETILCSIDSSLLEWCDELLNW